jgi:hypothetical protein
MESCFSEIQPKQWGCEDIGKVLFFTVPDESRPATAWWKPDF